MLIDVAISGDREDSKILRPYNRNTAHVECKNKGDTGNNRGDWDYFKVIQKIRERHTTRKTLSQGTTENSHIGHCTHTHTHFGKYCCKSTIDSTLELTI